MWDWIVNILFEVLRLIQSFAVDWGLSIIILVLIVRLLLTPLMLKSTKSTARMQVLQPKLQEIQERYADYSKNKDYLEQCYRASAEKALAISLRTLRKVMKKIGYIL